MRIIRRNKSKNAMAIIIEGEKRKINWFASAIVVLVVFSIATATYYLFFASTPLIEKVVPSSVQSLQVISSIKLQPELIINDPKFQILKQYVNPVGVGAIGKSNPFLK